MSELYPTTEIILELGATEPGEALDEQTVLLVDQVAGDFGRRFQVGDRGEVHDQVVASLMAVREKLQTTESESQAATPSEVDRRSYLLGATAVLLQADRAYTRRELAEAGPTAQLHHRAPIRAVILQALEKGHKTDLLQLYKLTDKKYDRDHVRRAVDDLFRSAQLTSESGSRSFWLTEQPIDET
jgi:hypothetical protein